MEGAYYLPTSELDFDVQVFVGNKDEANIGMLFTSLFSPLSYALEIDLRGTIESPRWNFDLSPVNLFASPDDPERISSEAASAAAVSQISLSNLQRLPIVESSGPEAETARVSFPPEPL